MPAWISDFLKKGPCTEEQRTLSDKLDNIGEKEDKDDDDENSVRAQPTRSSSSQGPSDDDDDDDDDVIDNDDGNDPSIGADTDQMDEDGGYNNQEKGDDGVSYRDDDGHYIVAQCRGLHGDILPHNYHSDGESIADLGKKGRRYNSKREEKQLVKKLFQNINRTRRCVCLVGNCKAELDISNKRAHLRAIHKMLPPLQCNFCPFGTYSRTIFRRHDCQNTTKRF